MNWCSAWARCSPISRGPSTGVSCPACWRCWKRRHWTAGPITAVVIDGYVTLDVAGRAGLGAYLYGALGSSVPVIGVAKTAFQGSPHALPLCRGDSQRPLYITAAGMDIQLAARCIAQMAGPHRLPGLLKRADQVCRRAP